MAPAERVSPPRYSPAGPHVAVSALLGHGLEELKARLEEAVLRATGRHVLTLRVRLAGPQLRCGGGRGGGGGGGGRAGSGEWGAGRGARAGAWRQRVDVPGPGARPHDGREVGRSEGRKVGMLPGCASRVRAPGTRCGGPAGLSDAPPSAGCTRRRRCRTCM